MQVQDSIYRDATQSVENRVRVEDCDAIVAAWLPGSEANAIADVLVGDAPFTGKLPFTWFKSMEQLPLTNLQNSKDQPLWQFGFGLSS
jgi:beta-glucosidase